MTDKAGDDIIEALREHMRKEKERDQAQQFTAWCSQFAAIPCDYAPKLNPGLVADIELAPMRWLRAGIELIKSAKGTTPIQLMDGVVGPPMQTYLPYPVFQAGAEIFLKGMWLAQFDDCRAMESSVYVAPEVRKRYQAQLKKLGHDVLGIVDELRKIARYSEEGTIARFLAIVSGVARTYYYPLTEDDRAWANARYPRRFYDDTKLEAHADQFREYPEQWPLVLLFDDVMPRVDRLWGITEGLLKSRKDARTKNSY